MGNPDGERRHVASEVDDRLAHRGNQFIVLDIAFEINDGLAVCEEQRLIDHLVPCRHHDDGIAFFGAAFHGHGDSFQAFTDFHIHVIGCKIVHHGIFRECAGKSVVHGHGCTVILYGEE